MATTVHVDEVIQYLSLEEKVRHGLFGLSPGLR
jgi:hypothetical protein